MSTSIKSFGQSSVQTVSAFENGGAVTVSSFGPKNVLRLRADASQYSKSGGSVQIRGIGNQSYLHAKELRLVQPVQIRFKAAMAGNRVCMINPFLDTYRSKAGNGAFQMEDMDAFATRALNPQYVVPFNGVRAVDNGLFKSFSNCVLSINGSSWQCRPSSFIDSFDKIFGECRFDSEGNATPCPPYTNAFGHPASTNQPGYLEACQSFIQNARVVYVNKATETAAAALITDIVYEVDFVTKLCIGPLAYASHPSLTNLTECDIHALPHVHDLSLEWSYKANNPLMQWIKTVCTDLDSGMAVDCSDAAWLHGVGGGDKSGPNTLQLDNTQLGGLDTDAMWRSAVAQVGSIANAQGKTDGKYLNLLRPYVTYQLSENNAARINYKKLYTIPSIRFTTYQQDTAIGVGKPTGKVNFEYINVDNLASLVCISVFESDRDGSGTSVGPRQPKFKSGAFQRGCRGAEFHNISCPIRWDTVKINLSIANSCLGSVTAGLETKFTQYATYLKYAKNKVSYNSWEKYNQMLIFSPQELCDVGMALESKKISLSVSFEYERTAADTTTTARDWMRNANDLYYPKVGADGIARAQHKSVNYQASLWFLNQEVATLSPGQCGISMLTFSPAEVQSAFTSASRTLESPVLDQFVA